MYLLFLFFHYSVSPDLYTYLTTIPPHDTLPLFLQLLGAAEATHRELEQQNDGATDRASQHHGDGVVQLGLRKRRAGRDAGQREDARLRLGVVELRSEEHTSELQSLMRI